MAEQQQYVENPLLNADLVTRVLQYLDGNYLELERTIALVCSVWRDVTRSWELRGPYRLAFWERFATQDENTLGEMEPLAPKGDQKAGRDGVDWRAECCWRFAGGLEGWEAKVEPRKVCEITGDVLFACAATLPSDLFIAGSESGTIYFLDVDEHDEDAAIVFSFQAHSSTIRAVRAVRTGTKPHATYRVISTDVENSVRVHNVDPFVAKTATMETDFDMPVATTQIEIIHEVKDTLAAIVGLEDGRAVIAEGWEKGNHNLQTAMRVKSLYGGGFGVGRGCPVSYINLVAPIPPGGAGELLGRRETMAVTGTAGMPARTCFHHIVREHDLYAALDGSPVLQLKEHLDLDVSFEQIYEHGDGGPDDLSYDKAKVCSTNIGLARDGTLALGYDDGYVLATRMLPECQRERHRSALTTPHAKEVWDVSICGDVVYSTSQDGTLAACTKGGRKVARRDVGYVVRVKASPNRIVLLGFDAVLRVLERPT